MKTIIFAFAAMLVPAFAAAQAGPVVQQYTSTMTIEGTAISHTAATELTQLDEPGDMLWRSLEVLNLDASNAVYCSDSSGVCATAGATCNGWKIAAGASKAFQLFPGQRFYCLAASADVNAVVLRAR